MTVQELTISAGKKEASSFRLVATLGFAGMVSGIALAGVYEITRPIIEANNLRELKEAVLEVVPGGQAMREVDLVNEAGEHKIIYAAYDETGTFLGYAIEGSTPGFADMIRLLYGYDPQQGHVIGMKVLESLETPGLGDKIIKDASFVSQFNDLAVDPIPVVVKDGADADHEVDAITGATISSKAVVKAINIANESWLTYLPETPPAPPEEPQADTQNMTDDESQPEEDD